MDYFDWYAAYLHRTCPIVDAHRDLVTEVYRKRQSGEKGVLNKYYQEEFVKSGVNIVFASLFLGADELKECGENHSFHKGAVLKKALEMLAAFYEDLEETKGRVLLIKDRETLCRVAPKKGLSRYYRVGVLLYLEGLDMLEGEPELLRCFYAMGVRGAALTWNEREGVPNVFAKGCQTGTEMPQNRENEKKKTAVKGDMPPITDKGVQALFLMEKLGIFIDYSHLSKEAAWLLPSFTKKPYAATHSNAEAVCSHKRNLSDGEIREIAARGGVIGVNAYREFVMGEKGEKPVSEALCDHIAYLIAMAGERNVGFGLDIGEGSMLTDYKELPQITAALLRRGYSVETVKKILGGNWIRFLSELFML